MFSLSINREAFCILQSQLLWISKLAYVDFKAMLEAALRGPSFPCMWTVTFFGIFKCVFHQFLLNLKIKIVSRGSPACVLPLVGNEGGCIS
jgi:hypothetical protein